MTSHKNSCLKPSVACGGLVTYSGECPPPSTVIVPPPLPLLPCVCHHRALSRAQHLNLGGLYNNYNNNNDINNSSNGKQRLRLKRPEHVEAHKQVNNEKDNSIKLFRRKTAKYSSHFLDDWIKYNKQFINE
jgi:hypothetical protein